MNTFMVTGETLSIDVTASSQRVQLSNSSSDVDVLIFNDGTATAWIKFGDASVIASETNCRPVGSGIEAVQSVSSLSGSIYVAAIAAGTTGKIYFTPGIVTCEPTPTPEQGILVNTMSVAAFQSAIDAAQPNQVIQLDPSVNEAPQTINITSQVASPGAIIKGNLTQIVKIVCTGAAGLTLCNFNARGDRVQGNLVEQPVNTGIFLISCTNMRVMGNDVTESYEGIEVRGGSDIEIAYNNIYAIREDFIKTDGADLASNASKVWVHDNLARDNVYIADIWQKYDNATSPVFYVEPSPDTGWKHIDPNHTDGWQSIYEKQDLMATNNTFGPFIGKGIQWGNAASHRIAATGNIIQVALQGQISIEGVDSALVSNNTILPHPDPHPVSVDNRAFVLHNGSGGLRGGKNDVPPGFHFDQGTYTADLANPTTINGDVVTAPTAPTVYSFSTNYANLSSRPPFTSYSGPPVLAYLARPAIVASSGPVLGGNIGDNFCATMPYIKGYTFAAAIEANVWWRWRDGGGTIKNWTKGPSGMYFQATRADAALVVDFSWDGASVAATSPAVTIGASKTWDPANTNAGLTLSNANLTATDNGTTNTVKLAKGTTYRNTDGDYEVVLTPSYVGGDSQAIGFVQTGVTTGQQPGAVAGSIGLFRDGSFYGPSITTIATGLAPASGNMLKLRLRISGGNTVYKLFYAREGTWATGCGDPTGAGAGWDISALVASGGLTFAWNGYTGLGDACDVSTGAW